MTIEPVTLSDLPAMAEIERQANAFPWSDNTFASCFSTGYFSFKLLDAAAGLCGFYVGQQIIDQAELFNICVAPAMQGRGYGAQLLQHFMQQARQRQAQSCFLEVRSGNSNAIALYTKNGFRQCGLRRAYYRSDVTTQDAVLMQCPLL